MCGVSMSFPVKYRMYVISEIERGFTRDWLLDYRHKSLRSAKYQDDGSFAGIMSWISPGISRIMRNADRDILKICLFHNDE